MPSNISYFADWNVAKLCVCEWNLDSESLWTFSLKPEICFKLVSVRLSVTAAVQFITYFVPLLRSLRIFFVPFFLSPVILYKYGPIRQLPCTLAIFFKDKAGTKVAFKRHEFYKKYHQRKNPSDRSNYTYRITLQSYTKLSRNSPEFAQIIPNSTYLSP